MPFRRGSRPLGFIMKALFVASFAAPLSAQTTEQAAQASSGTAAAVSSSAAQAPLPGFSTATLPVPSIPSAPAVAISTAEAPAAIPRPWVLGDIAVKGNKNVKFSVIRSQVKARKGDLYDRPDLDRDVQSVLGLGSFERVAADITLTDKPVPENLRKVAGAPRMILLTFIVKEKPLIKKIIFSGYKKLSKGVLGDATTLKAKDPLDTVKLHEDEGKILDKYHEKGFLDATVSSQVKIDTTTLEALVTYVLSEGPKSRIGLVTIDGVKAFKMRKLLKAMKNRRKKVYVEKELKDDLKKVEEQYLNNGYLDVEVGTATVTVSKDKTEIFIRFGVQEGKSYRFGDSSFSGNTLYVSTELARALEYKRGKVFSKAKYEESIRGIQEMYADKGRLKARVTPVKTFNQATGLMDVNYAIVENSIVYIDHIDVEGNKGTKTHVLRREITAKPGDIFSAAKIRRSKEKIMNLGFIEDVDIDIQGTPDPDKVDITFDVSEGKPGVLTAGAAFSSVDGFIGTLSLSHLNLFGRAQQAKVEWQFGKRVQDYYLSWMTPWVYDTPMSLGVDLFNTRRIRPFQTSISAYVERNAGGTLKAGRRFADDTIQFGTAYTFSRISLSNIQDEFLGPLQPGTSDFSSLTATVARDTRDSIWDPTTGSRHALSFQLAGGPLLGQINFASPSLSDSWHYHLLSVGDYPLVLTLANRIAYITPFAATKEVPVNNRFYVGGQDNLRGYLPTGQVGFPSGGKVMEVYNAELGFPLAREKKKTIVKIVGFFDLGTAWDRVRDISGRVGTGSRDLKADVGAGIRFTTPAFPIRLDFGWGFNHVPGEKKYEINFGLGNLF